MATATAAPLDEFRMIWDRTPPMSRDRQHRLGTAQIARAAFALAEDESLQAISVKRVAARLGVPGNRMEQYLQSRDELLDIMLEAALAEIEIPELDLRGLAVATHQAVQAHPWLVELIGSRTPSGPAGLRFVETALRLLVDEGLSLPDAAQLLDTLLAFVAGSVRVQRRSRTAPSPAQLNVRARYLMDTVSDEQYPYLTELFSAAHSVSPAESFARGLDLVLGGIAARVPTGDRGAPPEAGSFP
ncbi:TetR/AcrR family transcriptional regulator C-terminal domain-containing protein [Jatrophihabitans telluris]|uniref:TetR/AcrR family transcriptional regulator C-terminal domain-containing protein n=1 Tax=Jatrophihabitans telluris TaxID=2038343 RepID=A0ABY4R0X0_9ACTN|nr:TetR/AcrR family transcriptional regulator C-terminal domain-containing protein [Jatrophihabitans telluris]UQX89414.1 TetR/AcrR family transcriptional regulator C-terminal domain-containing protein [Jatrophihabitans telluris]